MKNISNYLLTVSSIFIASTARADFCPKTISSSFEHILISKVTYDKTSKLYTYQYSVSNSKSSLVPIVNFDVEVFEEPKKIPRTANSDWFGYFSSSIPGDIKSEVQWSTTRSSAPKNPKLRAHSQRGMPDEAIQPGKIRTDFIFTSIRPPGLTKYYVDGYTELPVAIGDENNDDPDINCPNIDLDNSYDRTKVIGMTVGPADPSLINVELRLRKRESHDRFEIFDIRKPEEQVSLLVMGTKDFDPSTLNIQSIKFGPDEASVISSKLVDKNFGGDRDDEREEWECRRDDIIGKTKRPEMKNLLLTFNVKDLGVQCVLDKALFLTGTTKTGKALFGGVTAKIAGCQENKPGRRKALKQ